MRKKIFYIILIVLLNLMFLFLVIHQSQKQLLKLSPQYIQKHTTQQSSSKKLFLDIWRLIKSKYYDPTLNHQDWYRWKNHYLSSIETDDDVYVAVNSMLASLNDPYSRFMNKDEFEQQSINIDAKITGIGVNITTDSGKIKIVNVIEQSPAMKSDLKVDDIILKVDNKEIHGLSLSDVAHMLRGEKGSSVTLEILRNKQKLIKKIVRDEIKIKNVRSEMLNDDIAYIHILSFISSDLTSEFMEALAKTNSAKGIILDLRGNTGGLLPEAISIANIFIEKGTIVSILNRNGEKNNIYAQFIPVKIHKPLVILTDGSTASASEILSGALKDYNLAVLVGEKTYGKGMIQKIFPLSNKTGMNLTIGKYLTPNGTDIDKEGIEPNYNVKLTQEDYLKHNDTQLEKAKEVINTMISEVEEKENNNESTIHEKISNFGKK